MSARLAIWAAEPLPADVRLALERLAEAEDVVAVAVMPDVHLAHGVCIGTVTATTRLIYPAAVGGDIGCGMAAVGFDAAAGVLDNAKAAAVLASLYDRVPFIKHAVSKAPQLPEALAAGKLSAPSLEKLKEREGRLQFGTIGRGNHFIELQRDQEDRLWLAVHSGSRAMGPAIRDHHLHSATGAGALQWLDADTDRGRDYLTDVAWARSYARASRRAMVECIAGVVGDRLGSATDWSTYFDCDHNHVQRERHGADSDLWIHRKGALHAEEARPGVIPGSMGTATFHVEGRGLPAALCSSSHGAGRALSRSDARRRIPSSRLLEDAQGVWFDHRLTDRLREEAPAAYKDIGKVMRAQRELTRIVRRLRPLLVYKGA